MRRFMVALACLAMAAPTGGVLAAGVSLPPGPYPSDPGFGSNVNYTSTLHVAITGNDSTGTGTSAKPYATLNKALQVATAGTKIIIHQGIYTGYIYSTKQGTATAPILVTTAPGEGPVILDRLGTSGEVMHLTDAAYIIFENLAFRGSTDNGINVDDGGSYSSPAHHIILRNLTVEDIGTGGNNDGIKLSGVDNVYVLGCLIQRIRSGSGIDMVGCHDSVIAYNEFNDLVENGTQTKGGSRNVLILGNLFLRAGQRAMNMGGSTDLPYFRPLDATYEAKDIRAIGNLIKDTEAPVAYVGLVDGLAANNTIYMPIWYVVRILQETTTKDACQNGRFINNIIYFRTTDLNPNTCVNVGSNTLPATFTFANNLWYAVNNPSFGGYNLSPVPAEVGGIYRLNPYFTSLGDVAGTQVNDDFHLLRSSSARGRGLSLTNLEVPGQPSGDRDARRYLAAPTLGAYEVGLDGDANGDAAVDVVDLLSLVYAFGRVRGDLDYDVWADFNRDGSIDVVDLLTLVGTFGTSDAGS
jgi:hypothetical protein